MPPSCAEVSRGSRLEAVDLLRGIAVVVMTLDHVRAFFGTSGWDPGFASAGAATFLTRWVTHFCAPVFVLLAGTGAALSLGRGRSRPQLAWFLLTRGAWLALLDVSVVSFAWFFRIGRPWVSDVMWVIGWSMIVVAALVRMSPRVVALFGAAAFHVDPDSPPAGFGVSLGLVYLIWVGAVLAMYPLCRWFAAVKKGGRSAWLSYL